MDCKRDDMTLLKDGELSSMIQFAQSLGISVNMKTKARGHQGFFMHNRIDISTLLSQERKKEVLVHEFAHYIHYKIEPGVIKSHGNLGVIFNTDEVKLIEKELIEVTRFVDKSLALGKLKMHRNEVLHQIKNLDGKIKAKYPDFKRSYPFKPLDNPLKKTEAKYLLKYDRVKVKTPFLRREKEYSIKTFPTDFPQFEETIHTYIQLKSQQRILKRISSRINRLNRYYERPSELFARFVEGVFIDKDFVSNIAPTAYKRFFELLYSGYYPELGEFLALANCL